MQETHLVENHAAAILILDLARYTPYNLFTIRTALTARPDNSSDILAPINTLPWTYMYTIASVSL